MATLPTIGDKATNKSSEGKKFLNELAGKSSLQGDLTMQVYPEVDHVFGLEAIFRSLPGPLRLGKGPFHILLFLSLSQCYDIMERWLAPVTNTCISHVLIDYFLQQDTKILKGKEHVLVIILVSVPGAL